MENQSYTGEQPGRWPERGEVLAIGKRRVADEACTNGISGKAVVTKTMKSTEGCAKSQPSAR